MKTHNEIPLETPVKNRTKEQNEVRLCTTLPIIEVFTSIQGEGKFVGEPSLFIRVSGCNLRCCFKDSICDTPYSSFVPEKGRNMLNKIYDELTNHPVVTSIVITGGEPMLYAAAIDDLIDYITEMMNNKVYFVTVETNGTLPCADDTMVDMFSISPKLSTSVPSPNKVYKDPTGKTYQFTEERCAELNKTRFNPAATAQLIQSTETFQLKFVYSGPDSIKDIDGFLNELTEYGIEYMPGDILLMPEGITNELLTKNAQEAVKVCIERGWTLCDRLHIRIWGDKRGV